MKRHLLCALSVCLLVIAHVQGGVDTTIKIKIGAILSNATRYNKEASNYAEVAQAALNAIQTANSRFTFEIRIFTITKPDDSEEFQEMLCKMIDEKIMAFVSAITDSKQARIVTDMASALNLLHVSSVTHLSNLYQSLYQVNNPLLPSVYADYNIKINDLLYNYMQEDQFKWRRVVIIYDQTCELAVLGKIIEDGRTNKWVVSSKMLPVVEQEDVWRTMVSEQILNAAVRRAERYFVFLMDTPKAAALLTEAMRSNLTVKSFYFLIASPSSHEQVNEVTKILQQYPASQVNLLFVHRNDDETFVQKNLRNATMFLAEYLANYTDAVGPDKAWSSWPVRYDQITAGTASCSAVWKNYRQPAKAMRIGEILNMTASKLSQRDFAFTRGENSFQQLFNGTKYGQQRDKFAISQFNGADSNYTHKTVYPCKDCVRSYEDSVLRVVAYVDEPYIIANTGPDRALRPFIGFNVDILETIAGRLKVSLAWSSAAEGVIGRPSTTYGWNGIMKVLLDRNADVSGNLIEVNPARAEAIKFSEPVFAGGNLGLAKLNVTRVPDFYTFMEPFDSSLWFAILFVFVSSSLCFWFMSKMFQWQKKLAAECDEMNEKGNGEAHEVHEELSFGDCVWYTVAAMLCKDCEVEPSSFAGKLLSAFLAFFTVIIIGYYTANLAAFLAIEQKAVEIRTMDELSLSRLQVRVLDSGGTSLFLKEARETPTYDRIWNKLLAVPREKKGFMPSNKQGVADAKQGKYAWVGDSRSIKYWLSLRECATDMVLIGDEFGKMGYSFGFPRGSVMEDKFNRILLEMVEKSEIKKLEEKWFEGVPECEINKVVVQELSMGSATSALRASNVYGVIIILALGFCFASCVLLKQLLKLQYSRHKLKKLRMSNKSDS